MRDVPGVPCPWLDVASNATALVLGDVAAVAAAAPPPEGVFTVVPLPAGVERVAGGRPVKRRHALVLDAAHDVALVRATHAGSWAADGARTKPRRLDGGRAPPCARKGAGLAFTVGTSRDESGQLKIADVDHPDFPTRGPLNPDDDARDPIDAEGADAWEDGAR